MIASLRLQIAGVWGRRLCLLLAIAAVAVLIFGRAMDRDFNHDEHQFVGPSVLIGREGLLPYRDFALFHLPNLSLIYAALSAVSDHPTGWAKALCAFATAGMVVLISGIAGSGHPGQRAGWRWLVAGLCAVLLIFDPSFTFTTGKTWNHEIPGALVVAGIVLFAWGFTNQKWWIIALSGVAVGGAIGIRLTYAPLIVVFLACGWSAGIPPRARWTVAACFLGGAGLAMLPSLILYLVAPEQFMFGNFEAPRVRLLDLTNERMAKTSALWRKVRFFFKEVLVPSLPLFTMLAVVLLANFRRFPPKLTFQALILGLVGASIPFALSGCFTPSRYHVQHFYVITCLAALGIAAGIALHPPAKWLAPVLGVLALASVSTGWGQYRNVGVVFTPKKWYHVRMHELGERIRGHVKEGPVLTFAPTWPLEGRVNVYPEFAIGPFAYRMAHLIEPERRKRLKIVAPDDLPRLLAERPPGGILTGYDDEALEAPFIAWAEAHAYIPVKIAKKRVLWVRPGLREKVSGGPP